MVHYARDCSCTRICTSVQLVLSKWIDLENSAVLVPEHLIHTHDLLNCLWRVRGEKGIECLVRVCCVTVMAGWV